MDYNGFLTICQQGIFNNIVVTLYLPHIGGLGSLWDNVTGECLNSKIEASDDASEVCYFLCVRYTLCLFFVLE